MALSQSIPVAVNPRRNDLARLLLCFVITAAGMAGYSLWVGPVAFMGDSYLFADRAKHLYELGNLDLNNHGSLVYPPLYAVLIAPCYALVEAARVLTAMTVLNSLLLASSVFPVFLLLDHYAGGRGRERWFFTLLITASPAFVPYAPMILTEACFIPLIYWATYAFFRSVGDLAVGWFALTGFLMALALLLRSAAAGLFLSGFIAWLIYLFFTTQTRPTQKAGLVLAGLAAFAIPLLVWHLVEQRWVTYQGHPHYSSVSALVALASSRADQIIKLQWTLNALCYFLAAPLNLAGFLVLVTIARRPSAALHDPLIPFVTMLIALAIASIVLLAPTSYGGGVLTWNKYFAPFVGLVSIIALRLRPHYTGRLVLAALVAALVLPLARRPSGMVCHFPDALAPFMDSSRMMSLPAGVSDGLFFLLLASTVPLLVPSMSRRLRFMAGGLAASLGIFSTVHCARLWRNSGVLNFAQYDGLAARLVEALQREPDLPVFYDPALGTDQGEPLRFLFYYPRLIPQLPLANLFLEKTVLPEQFLYVTRSLLPTASLVALEGNDLKLFRVNGRQISKAYDYKVKYGENVGGVEQGLVSGKLTPIRWLGQSANMSFVVDRALPGVKLGLRLAVGDHARKAVLTLNGERLPDEPVVRQIPWHGGFDYFVWPVSLREGENKLILECDSTPLTLPDGNRKVTFIMIEDPILSKP